VSVGTVITAAQLLELETAIDNERTDATRRYNATAPSCSGDCGSFTTVACSTNSFSVYPWSGSRSAGDLINATHFDNVKSANNEVTSTSGWGGTVTATFSVGDLIEAADITELQTIINATRNACICDGHCSCDPSNCGCDAECPSHYYWTP
jgi:hypothetical protein